MPSMTTGAAAWSSPGVGHDPGNTIAVNATGLVLGASATPTLNGNTIHANAIEPSAC